MNIIAYGNPAPQGSKKHVGGGRMVESSKKVAPWRESVKWAAISAKGLAHKPFDGPLAVTVTFTLPKPASAPKTRVTFPQRKPDLDKLIRAVFDALTDAGVWVDDSRVVAVAASKVYPGKAVDALQSPGAVIRIREVAQ